MFRPLMLAIFRLYMNTYQVVIQTIYVLFLGERGWGCACAGYRFCHRGVCVVLVSIGNHAI